MVVQNLFVILGINRTPSQMSGMPRENQHVFHHKTDLNAMPTDDQFRMARLKYFARIPWKNISQKEKIEYLKLKHEHFGEPWQKGGPAFQLIEPGYELYDNCQRLGRPAVTTPRVAVVEETYFDTLQEMFARLNDPEDPTQLSFLVGQPAVPRPEGKWPKFQIV